MLRFVKSFLLHKYVKQETSMTLSNSGWSTRVSDQRSQAAA